MRRKIFLTHVPKTGGNYIRDFLSISDDFVNVRSHGYWGISPTQIESPLIDFRIGIDYSKKCDLKDVINVSCVRNPFRMLLSYYTHTRANYTGFGACNDIHSINSFENFIDKYCDLGFEWHFPLMKKNLFGQLYSSRGDLVVDHIIRTEFLGKSINILSEIYNIPILGRDLWRNESPSVKRSSSWKDRYTESMIKKVEKKCEFELDTFGYSFNSTPDDTFVCP